MVNFSKVLDDVFHNIHTFFLASHTSGTATRSVSSVSGLSAGGLIFGSFAAHTINIATACAQFNLNFI
jgi:hypothetical protein